MSRLIHIKRKQRILLALLLVGIFIVLTVGLIVKNSIDRNKPTEDRASVSEVSGIPIHEDILPEGSEGRPGIKRKIKYIVIHETANHSEGADAKAHAEYLKSGNSGTTSWHYTVDDHEIYQHIPDSEVAWHAGDKLEEGGGNLNGLSLELCVNDDGSFNRTFDNAARFTAYLLKEYELSVDDIKQHHDFSGKNCPMTIREKGRWQEFLNLVRQYLA